MIELTKLKERTEHIRDYTHSTDPRDEASPDSNEDYINELSKIICSLIEHIESKNG